VNIPRWLSTERRRPTWWRQVLALGSQPPWPTGHDRLHIIALLERELLGQVLTVEAIRHVHPMQGGEGDCAYDPRMVKWALC